MNTLKEAKDFLRVNFKNGIECPCCNQFVKRYKRKLSSSMAYGLIKFKSQNDYTHLYDFFKKVKNFPHGSTGDFAKLRHWGLIENLPEKRDDGYKSTGFYKITQKGIDFIEKKVKVPSHIVIYNQKPLCFEGEEVNIDKCLGNKFNYRELMS